MHRVYCALRLNLPRWTKRRLPGRLRQPLEAPRQLNHIWAIDFMADALYGGRKIRTLNVIDEGNREALAIDVALSIPSVRVIRILEELVALHGLTAGVQLSAVYLTGKLTDGRERGRICHPAEGIARKPPRHST